MITLIIFLKKFTLKECSSYLRTNNYKYINKIKTRAKHGLTTSGSKILRSLAQAFI